MNALCRIIAATASVVILLSSMATAQSIRLVRNDVDSTRAHFVTATFRFGFDVTLADVQGCNGAAFELRYSNAQYVRYSGYSGGDFGERGLFVIDSSNIATGDGKLTISVLSGKPSSTAGIDNPVVIRLDFVVTPDAPHGIVSSFNFISARAVINKDGGKIIDLQSENSIQIIHSYIDIWPGDADNNGFVDGHDGTVIGLFITDTDNQGRYRGLRRQPSSIYWYPQRALSWDSAEATYADCDGSGEVTLNDLLVVQLNFNHETTTGALKGGETPMAASPYVNPVPFDVPDAVKIPVYCRVSRPFIGAATRITWDDPGVPYHVVGIEPGDAFSGDVFCWTNINQDSHYADIAVGTINADSKSPDARRVIEPTDKFLLCYLVIDSLRSGAFPIQMLQHPTGITASGQFFPLELAPLSVEQTVRGAAFSATLRNYTINIESSTDLTNVSVVFYDILGHKTGSAEPSVLSSTTAEIPLPSFPAGYSFAVITAGKETLMLPLAAGK